MGERRLTVGVLGGMGPEATVDLLQRIIRGTPATDDSDHIRTLVDNNPGVPSRIEYVIHGRGKNPAPVLVEMARGLVAQGADFLIMPCNTAHLYADEITSAVETPFLNMVDVTVAATMDSDVQIGRVGLLASTAVIQTGLYSNAFGEKGVDIIVPADDQQTGVMALIKRVKAGKRSDSDISFLSEVAKDMLTEKADCLIIACTELSALGTDLSLPIPVIDASQCLAEETIRIALGSKSI